MKKNHLGGICARLTTAFQDLARIGVLFLVLCTGGVVQAQGLPQGVWAVDADATGENDGTSWEDAFTTLTAALDNEDLLSGDEIWVAEGTYQPGTTAASTFSLKAGVSIYGGFDATESLLSQRNPNPETNGCILSGLYNGPNWVYHVVTATNISFEGFEMIHLDGFTVRDGRATGSNDDDSGGGILCIGGGNVRINNCIIEECYSDVAGGGAAVR